MRLVPFRYRCMNSPTPPVAPERDYVRAGALMRCDKGALPSVLNAPPRSPFLGGSTWCNTSDCDPVVNTFNFGVCTLTQKPCLATCRPLQWLDAHPSLEVAGRPALLDSSSILCAIGGRITFVHSGQLG